MKSLVNDTIALAFRVQAPVKTVFRALGSDIGRWWSHRFHEDGTVELDPRVGGAFRELWREGGALYATVIRWEADRRITLSGPMGMTGAVAAAIDFSLEPDGEGTRVQLIHDILGWLDPATVGDYREGWENLLTQAMAKHLDAPVALVR